MISGLEPVTLRAITYENLHAVLDLSVADHQRKTYPQTNAHSIAEAHYPADDDAVWLKAIYAGETPVGLILTSKAEDRGEYFLWRLMIDQRFQGHGYGRSAVQLLIERIRQTDNPKVLITSHLQANSQAGYFYEQLGFEYTGEKIGPHDLELQLTF